MNMWDSKIDVERDTRVFQVALCIYVRIQERTTLKDLSEMPPKVSLEVEVVDTVDADKHSDKNSRPTPEGFIELNCTLGLPDKDLADVLSSLLQQKVLTHANVLKCGKGGFDLKVLEVREFDSDSFSSVDGFSFLSSSDRDDSAQWFFEVKADQTALKAYLGKYLELWKDNQFNDYNLNILDSEQQIQIIKDQIVGLSNKTASDTQVLSSPEVRKDSFLDLFATAWYLEVNGVIQIVEILSVDSLRIKHLAKDIDLTSLKFETDDDYGYLKIPDQKDFKVKKDTNQFQLLRYLYTKIEVNEKSMWQDCYEAIYGLEPQKNEWRKIHDLVRKVNAKAQDLWKKDILLYREKEVVRLV